MGFDCLRENSIKGIYTIQPNSGWLIFSTDQNENWPQIFSFTFIFSIKTNENIKHIIKLADPEIPTEHLECLPLDSTFK